MTNDLFPSPLIPGFASGNDFVAAGEEEALIRAIDAVDLSPFRFRGWLGRRLTASFGWQYDFDTASFAPTVPIPRIFLPIRARAAAFAGLPPQDLVQMLVIRYDPGAAIGWHRDRPVFEHVLGISLGAEAKLRLRRRSSTGFVRVAHPLARGSIYHLRGEARYDWEHSIAPIDLTRWSITFRTLSARSPGS